MLPGLPEEGVARYLRDRMRASARAAVSAVNGTNWPGRTTRPGGEDAR
jgi:hypothetical protein